MRSIFCVKNAKTVSCHFVVLKDDYFYSETGADFLYSTQDVDGYCTLSLLSYMHILYLDNAKDMKFFVRFRKVGLSNTTFFLRYMVIGH